MSDDLPELSFDEDLPELSFGSDQASSSASDTSAHPWTVGRAARDIGVGLGGAAQGFANIPRDILSTMGSLQQHGPAQAIAQEITGGAGSPLNNLIALAQDPRARKMMGPDIDFQKLIGPQQPTGGDILLQKGVEYGAPLGAGMLNSAIRGASGEALSAALRVASPKAVIKNAAKKSAKILEHNEAINNSLYNPIHKAVGKTDIYSLPNEGTYLKPTEKEFKRIHYGDQRKLHEDFLKNPTFDNAHLLQSQLGEKLRSYIKMAKRSGGTLPAADVVGYNLTEDAQNSLRRDMGEFLDMKNPNLRDQYAKAAKHHLDYVVPHRNFKNILENLGKHPRASTVARTIEDAEQKKNMIMPRGTDKLADAIRGAMLRKKVASYGLGSFAAGAAGIEAHNILSGEK